MGLWSGHRTTLLGAVVAILAAACVFAPGAGAVLVHVGNGQVAGVAPVNGVSPSAIPGSVATHRLHSASGFSTNGNLDYNGGPVLHASSPFLIFWDPSSQISTANKALFERFFADVAHDSGLATNVYSVDRQFTDGSGFADYSQSWSAGHAIIDTHAYPSLASQCDENAGFTETTCLFDGQIQAEVQRVVAADGLPTGVSGSAPIYFVVTPPTVNSCFSDDMTCADNFFCAYHSSFSIGGNTALYANIPTLLAVNDPKGCQADGHSQVQHPNGAATQIADVAIKYMSHEDNETITDPVNGSGWVDDATGQEDGDNCNFTGSFDPGSDTNPDAFLPVLGGTAAAQNLFDQSINANDYYIQSEWSNGDVNCKMRPTTKAITAAFSGPANAAVNNAATFNPSATTSTGGFTSTTWSFGDGSGSFSRSGPVSINHTYSAPGTHTVKLTVVDDFGNLSTVSHTIIVRPPPTAAFTIGTAHAVAGSPVAFNGSGSSEPGGVGISGFSWDFGDSGGGSGSILSHTYAHAGTFTVKLTVTDALGAAASTTHQVTVSGVPSAVISAGASPAVAGVPVTLSAGHSTDIGSSISSDSWSFGDGATGSGASVSHAFTRTGTLPVRLTVTDASGATSTTTLNLAVVSPVITAVKVKKGKKVEKLKVSVTGPGKLKAGSATTNASGPGTFTISVKLSKAKRARLKAHHAVTLRVKVKFVPTFGTPSSTRVKIKIRG